MEYINFGKVVNVSASVPVAVNDTVYHIIIDFVPNCPEIFDSFHTDMGKILEWPDDYVLCNVSDIKELEDLGADLNEHIKNLERIKEFLINGNATLIDENSKLKATNQTLKDRIKELEKNLKAANKQLDKMDADIDELKNKNRDLEKELAESKTFAEVEYKWQSDGSFTVTYTKCDGSKQTIGMDLANDTGDKCTMGAFVCRSLNIPQCKNCKNHRYFTNGGHFCHLPDSKYKIPGMFHVNPLTDEEAEGPACNKFEARKE